MWHEHPVGSAEPSETDLRSWNAASEDHPDGFVALIVADTLNPTRMRMLIHGWIASAGVVEPANIYEEPRRIE
jgi:proteasome lid subunit RPN8/RPN11